jgi:hypothetical protein
MAAGNVFLRGSGWLLDAKSRTRKQELLNRQL